MISIALVHEHTWPMVQRGAERYLHDLAWYLHHHTDLDTSVVTAWGRPRVDRRQDVLVSRTWPLAFPPLGRLSKRHPRATSSVSGFTGGVVLRRHAPSLVHALSPNAALAGHRAGLPTVFTTVGTPGADDARRHPRRWRSLARASATAQVVTAVGKMAAADFAEALGRPVAALQPGIRLDLFEPRLEPRSGPPRVLFASTVTPANKGFAAVLDAFPAIVDSCADARLLVLGPGDVVGAIDRAGPSVRRLRDRVDHEIPSPTDMPKRFANGTVTVLASSGEAFGLVLAESLACGTPIVASTEGGPAEILGDGDGLVGHAAKPHDADAIAGAALAAIELAHDPATPARCREHARQWSWTDGIGARHRALYDSVLGGRPGT